MAINYKKNLNLRRIASDPKKLILVLIFIALVIFVENYFARVPSFETRVVRVIDGDTIEIDKNKERIRLYGIDAPELKQSFGKKSKQALEALIAGKNIKIISKGKDKYDRILAVVEFKGKDINKLMVSWGYAWANSYYSDLYLEEQNNAKAKKIGLWKEDKPIEPYKWRKQNMLNQGR